MFSRLAQGALASPRPAAVDYGLVIEFHFEQKISTRVLRTLQNKPLQRARCLECCVRQALCLRVHRK